MREKDVLMEIDLPFPKLGKKEAGEAKKTKIREVFDVGQNLILMVATDRVSVNDIVLLSGIPGKGEVLTKISAYWFKETKDVCLNAFISDEWDDFPIEVIEELKDYRNLIENRSMLMFKTRPFPVECIVRNKLLESGWDSYIATGTLHGIPLPKGMQKGDKLPAPAFTPSTKAKVGKHDENITFGRMQEIIGPDNALRLRSLSLSLYCYAQSHARQKGIEIDDTKFEFGIFVSSGELMQIDESLTPDSSRYNPDYSKQPLRDYLKKIGWDKTPIELPDEVIKKTSRDYIKGCEILTGHKVKL